MHLKFQIVLLYIFCCFSLTISAQNQKQENDSVQVTIKNIGKEINSPFHDYAPVISADGSLMIFTSRRPASENEIKKNKEAMESIWSSMYDSNAKKWSAAKRLGASVNQPGRHNSAIALSNDGQTLLLYHDDSDGNGDIYQSKLEGNEWTEAVKFPEPVNSNDHESSASISPDGRTIYFVSNRKGGQGGKDIWYCTQDVNGKWGKAKNIAQPVNTKEDEEGIFIHPDGKTIYFSSKGNNSIGGFDIFKSSFENQKWTVPVNLGSAINTAGDDLFFVLTADGKTGYYASAKAGGIGEKDIYEIKFTPLEKKKDEGPKLTLFSGIVIDKLTSAPLGSDIEITDNDKNESFSKIKSNSATGKFLISLPSGKNYGINVSKEGYLFYSDNVTIPDTGTYKEINKTIALEKINAGSKIVLKNIFYDFDKATLRPASINELDRLVQLMHENTTLKIELAGYTDSEGTDQYNMRLSQSRAQSVAEYLISKGISSDRLIAQGYGETQPIAANETEEGRQMNRRTEFKILSK